MPAAGTTKGPVHAVPCAHCGHAQDLRVIDAQKLLDVNAGVVCDHCDKTSNIVSIREIKFVVLRQI